MSFTGGSQCFQSTKNEFATAAISCVSKRSVAASSTHSAVSLKTKLAIVSFSTDINSVSQTQLIPNATELLPSESRSTIPQIPRPGKKGAHSNFLYNVM